MKSKLKKRQIVSYLLLLLLIEGLVGGFLYDLGSKMPFALQLTLIILLIGYPIFVVYTYLKIPAIELKEDRIVETAFKSRKEIRYSEISEIYPSKFFNKLYKIGTYYSIQSKDGRRIALPLKMYSNEKELIQQIERNVNSIKNEIDV